MALECPDPVLCPLGAYVFEFGGIASSIEGSAESLADLCVVGAKVTGH